MINERFSMYIYVDIMYIRKEIQMKRGQAKAINANDRL